VVADLEDAVPPDEKAQARELVRDVLSDDSGPPLRIVRVNGPDTPYFADDLALVGELRVDALVLPKASPDALGALGADGPPVIAIVETPHGLRLAFETASSRRVVALALGAVDLGVALGLAPRRDGLELLFARSQLVVDSAAAQIAPPLDSVYVDYRDDVGLRAEATLARSLGFRGKLCIHPNQVAVVNEVFVPTEAELAWAHRVVEVFEDAEREGRGAVGLDGAMIDLAVVERARRILAASTVE
jgi:citrate lyase subunit beta/citryl-CoA lyase